MFIPVSFLIYLLTNDVRATNTLSTSSKSLDDIVRPTASSRSYLSELVAKSVNEQALYNTSVLSRKFDNSESDERLNEIWNWDYWCRLQPVVGNCDDSIQRYYYDIKTELCKPISYSGCKGGKNLFETKKECERTCVGSNDMLKLSSNLAEQLDCFYQPDPGLCLGSEEQLFYDVNLEVCRTFIYGGCGGNGNRFMTNGECLGTCKETKRRSIRENEPIVY